MLNKLKWAAFLLKDMLKFGTVNRSYLVVFALLGLFVLSLAIAAAEVAAPFIYTLF